MDIDPITQFEQECKQRVRDYENDTEFCEISKSWINYAFLRKYMYNFSFYERPIIQLPQDILAVQEIILRIKPDLIIETGIAHGGSLINSASMLEIIGDNGDVLGIDIDIRLHNRLAIENHPMFKRITLFEGDSTSTEMAQEVRNFSSGKKQIMVILDSNHTHEHVMRELELYAPLVTIGSYCIVFDTIIDDLPKGFFQDRPWDVGNNPKTAVRQFLQEHNEFVIDKEIENKLLITAAPDGYLRRVYE